MKIYSFATRLILLLGILCVSGAAAQTASVRAAANPLDLVRRAVANEISSADSSANYMFQQEKRSANGSQTKLMVETRDAMVGLLIAIDGHPLNPDQRNAEMLKLDQLAKNPAEMKKKEKREKEDTERTKRIIAAFPEAFLFEANGSVPGTEGTGAPGDTLVRLNFRPNPDYSPPSHVEQVLTGMRGVMLIDSKQARIAKIDGTLIKEVAFGWGILGHLDQGGHFIVQQSDVGHGHWEVTTMDLAFTGKALMFKSLSIKEKEVFSNFRPAPRGLTFAEGVELLKRHEQEMAENSKVQTKLENGSHALLHPPIN